MTASTLATLLDPQFDFRKSYVLIAGIAGIDPARGTLGSTAWARWLVQNQDKAQQAVVEALEGWRERLHAPDEERFWTAGAASAIAALTLLGPRHANIIAIPMQPIFEFFKLQG